MEHYYMISLSENTRLPATPVLESPPREKYTITILIGNSDDKLTQKEWSSFYNEVNVLTVIHTTTTHFAGASMPDKPWQNACWVVDVSKTHQHAILKEHLDGLRKKYRQDSIAWVEGETKFIEQIACTSGVAVYNKNMSNTSTAEDELTRILNESITESGTFYEL